MADATPDLPLLADDLLGPGVPRIAKAMNLPVRHVRHLIDMGRVPVTRLPGSPLYYARRSQLEAIFTTTTKHRRPEPDPEPEPLPAPVRRRRRHSWAGATRATPRDKAA
jgi:hypothetical protein